MEFDGENFDMLEDVDMDVGDNPLDDSNLMLETSVLNDELQKHHDDGNNENTNENSVTNDQDDDDDDDGDDDDDDENAYAERSTVASNIDGTEGESMVDAGEFPVVGRKRERSNAKAVECLDLDGNLIEVFRSGLAASSKLNIPQGDISLCCRGLKQSVSGYKFRFRGDTEDRSEFKLKRGYGYVIEPVNESKDNIQISTATRTTRASRGEYSIGNPQNLERLAASSSKEAYKAIAAIKVKVNIFL